MDSAFLIEAAESLLQKNEVPEHGSGFYSIYFYIQALAMVAIAKELKNLNDEYQQSHNYELWKGKP